MTSPTATALLWRTSWRFLLAVAVGNLAWEVAHVPLYTLWLTGSPAEISYAVIHCTAGDVLIAGSTLMEAWALVGRYGWPDRGYLSVAIAMVLMAVGYTVFSEWLNVEVRGSWAYRDLMPRLLWIGTGLTPVIQWIIVPAAAFWWARPRRSSV
jgi:hypothetical protein